MCPEPTIARSAAPPPKRGVVVLPSGLPGSRDLPNGTDLWLTHDAFLQPSQSNTSKPRLVQGVVGHAS